MADAGIGGAEKLAAVGARLKEAGDGRLRRELLAGVRNAAKPVIPAIRESAGHYLPRSGGLAALVASQKFAVRTSLSSGKVSLVGSGMKSMTSIDEGTVRHPTFARTTAHSGGNLVGRRMGEWHAQKVTPRFFTRPIEDHEPEIKQGIEKVMSQTAAQIDRSV